MMSSIAMEEEEEEEEAAEEHQQQSLLFSETSSSSSGSPPQPLSSDSEAEEDEELAFLSPPTSWGGGGGKRRILTKQLSMRETKMELKWEKRRRQMSLLRRPSEKSDGMVLDEEKEVEMVKRRPGRVRSLTDEDLDELRGSIDLGFGFSEEDGGHDLCKTLPALNLYFAVNRQLSDPKMRSPASTPTTTTSSASTLYGTPSPRSFNDQPQEDQQQQGRSNSLESDAWKIFNPGDSPQHVKTRLRHWAQIVACSVRQCC